MLIYVQLSAIMWLFLCVMCRWWSAPAISSPKKAYFLHRRRLILPHWHLQSCFILTFWYLPHHMTVVLEARETNRASNPTWQHVTLFLLPWHPAQISRLGSERDLQCEDYVKCSVHSQKMSAKVIFVTAYLEKVLCFHVHYKNKG